jgi:hypothetical protein
VKTTTNAQRDGTLLVVHFFSFFADICGTILTWNPHGWRKR